MANPRITGIVCTRNRKGFLRKCLDSMLDQTLSRDDFEVLVVDNGSSDGTPDLLEEYRERGVRSVHESVAGLSRARNTGCREARGKYVGYLDDDGVAERTWFEAALASFETVSPAPEWVGGPIALDCEVPLPEWVDSELRVPLGEVDWGENARFLNKEERLGGGNSFFPRELLAEVGGFEETLGRDGKSMLSADETQLQLRIEARGGRLYYHPGVKMHHFVSRERTEPGWFYRRYFWGGISDVIMRRSLDGVEKTSDSNENVSSNDGSRLIRILKNLLFALGLGFSRIRTVRGRVYMSYVIGYMWALLRGNREGTS